ncbi:MAG: hypothetical protein IAG10_13675 [Planctomycetaceae bacterium]|nr:hypothetical protein [Planctomycetaceae bacterium]
MLTFKGAEMKIDYRDAVNRLTIAICDYVGWELENFREPVWQANNPATGKPRFPRSPSEFVRIGRERTQHLKTIRHYIDLSTACLEDSSVARKMRDAIADYLRKAQDAVDGVAHWEDLVIVEQDREVFENAVRYTNGSIAELQLCASIKSVELALEPLETIAGPFRALRAEQLKDQGTLELMVKSLLDSRDNQRTPVSQPESHNGVKVPTSDNIQPKAKKKPGKKKATADEIAEACKVCIAYARENRTYKEFCDWWNGDKKVGRVTHKWLAAKLAFVRKLKREDRVPPEFANKLPDLSRVKSVPKKTVKNSRRSR